MKEENSSFLTDEQEDLLEHYKCTICGFEFYFVKDEKEIEKGTFKDDAFAEMPIFKKENKSKIVCPNCKASKRNLLYIKGKIEKKNELEKVKEKLKELKEKEAKLDEKKAKVIKDLAKEIEDDVLKEVKSVVEDLKSQKYSVDVILKDFRREANRLVSYDTKLYNERNRDVNVVLSNSYLIGFDRVISDFCDSIRSAFQEMKIENRYEEKSAERKLNRDDITDDEKEMIKDDLSGEISRNKDEYKNKISDSKDEIKDNGFKGYLRNKVK